jgi:Xaa-Pro aminopeptidase
MQYSPRAAVPSISRVDAGTVELIRSLGVKVVSSGDLVAAIESSLSPAQADSHVRAARALHAIVGKAFSFIAGSGSTDESHVQRFILNEFRRRGLVTNAPPIVAADKNSAFPHYATPRSGGKKIGPGSWVLLDLWAKEDRPGAIYADITWCGFVGTRVPEKYERIFKIVRDARERALSLVESRFHKGRPLKGWEVDRAARDFISSAGYGRFFLHRTGHSIGTEDHANGANMDSLETFETRRVLPNSVFSIEPGIYLKNFGVRSEINVWMNGILPTVTGGFSQESVFPVLAGPKKITRRRPG